MVGGLNVGSAAHAFLVFLSFLNFFLIFLLLDPLADSLIRRALKSARTLSQSSRVSGGFVGVPAVEIEA